LRHDGLDPHKLFQRRNATEAEVVAADIGHDGDVAAVEAESRADDAPRAVSNTAKSTAGFFNTIWALEGPAISPAAICVSSI
jgi:hypothetical protein